MIDPTKAKVLREKAENNTKENQKDKGDGRRRWEIDIEDIIAEGKGRVKKSQSESLS